VLRNARLLDGRPPLAQSSGRITGGSGDGYDSDSEDAVDEDEDATPGECIVDGKEKGGGEELKGRQECQGGAKMAGLMAGHFV